MVRQMERTTFMTYETVLRKIADLCTHSADNLRAHADEANTRYELALRHIADEQQHMVDRLRAYADHGPQELLDTQLQFADEALALDDDDEAPQTAGAALSQLQARNKAIRKAFADYAAAAAPEDLAGLLGNVSDLFEAHSRALTVALEQARDM